MKKLNPKIWISKSARRGSLDGAVRYFAARRTELVRNMRNARTYYSVEAIHELRVEVKRIRALLQLVAQIDPEFEAVDLNRELKHVFKTAGRLRDLDIQQEIVGRALRHENLSEYFNYLKLLENALRPGLTEACKAFPDSLLAELLDRLQAAVRRLDRNESLDKSSEYLNSQLNELARLCHRKHPSVDQLHRIRKLAKTARYTLEIWSACYGKSARANSLTARLKSLHTSLGEWHDVKVTRDAVSGFLKQEAGLSLFDAAAYTRFQAGLKHREEQLLRRYQDAAAKLAASARAEEPSHLRG